MHSSGLPPAQQFIDRELAWAKDEDRHGSEQEKKRRRADEGVGIRPDRLHHIEVRRAVGDEHGKDEGHAGDSGKEANQKQQPTKALGATSHAGIELWKGNAELREEGGGYADVTELAFASLEKLPAPVEADAEQKRICQITCGAIKESVGQGPRFHDFWGDLTNHPS